jgi:hypothetical protein
MTNNPCKKYSIAVFILLSLLAHLLILHFLALTGLISFSAPVQPLSALFVTLKSAEATPATYYGKSEPISSTPPRQAPQHGEKEGKSEYSARIAGPPKNFTQSQKQTFAHETVSSLPLAPGDRSSLPITLEPQEFSGIVDVNRNNFSSKQVPLAIDYEKYKGSVRNIEEFLTTKKEKLTYRISLLKIPVGTAIMEARNTNDEFRVSIRIVSNKVFSAVYPVDDLIETRMIKGNYLLTRVRQNEGSYRGDFGFTLMLREHKAFWVDRLNNRYNYESLPVDDVMDAVTGFYFLRNRDLEVGNTVELHLFDSYEYSPTTVEVLRKERIELPGGNEVDTLVLHPLFRTAGFFRRTGDITIWLTDDKFHVPVRLETYITLGKVTAELISAESEQEENVNKQELPESSSAVSAQ